MDMGQQLIDRCISLPLTQTNVFSTADDAYYRLVEDDDSTALNIGEYVVCGNIKKGQVVSLSSLASHVLFELCLMVVLMETE